MKKRFVDLWNRCAKTSFQEPQSSEVAEAVFYQLEALYGQPWRRYHCFSHIEWCLYYFDECRQYADSPDALELAIWFHDCIYTIGASDNEALSRDWFLDHSEGYLEESIREFVAMYIMDTYHRDNPSSEDGKLMVDIDLSNLGAKWDIYIKDSEAVMAELMLLEPVTERSVKEQVLVFLQNLLDRKYIYHSPHYRTYFETMAQTNIARYSASLKASL